MLLSLSSVVAEPADCSKRMSVGLGSDSGLLVGGGEKVLPRNAKYLLNRAPPRSKVTFHRLFSQATDWSIHLIDNTQAGGGLVTRGGCRSVGGPW